MKPELLSLTRVWDRAPHSAFTDLLRHRGRWWCTFREADDHGPSLGTLRVLSSTDGAGWTSVAEVAEAGVDLRDPKLSVTPGGRMMLLTCACVYDEGNEYQTRSPRVCFSDDGESWTTPARFLAEDHWLWRVTWHGGVGYGVSKLGEGDHPRRGFLYRTRDGLEWEWLTEFLLPRETWTASETTVRILPDERMVALVRPNWIGVSEPPYRDFEWTELEERMGGPNFLVRPGGDMWACARGRHLDGGAATVLSRMTATEYEPVMRLPSGGDCSYPGMAWHDGLLWMSYYSSHEGKACIYLARLRLP